MLTLNLNTDIEQELNAVAKQSGKPVEALVQAFILNCLEDIHDADLGDAAMERLGRGESSTVSFSEVKRQLNDLEN
ncbi:MAG: hypothetical protein KAG26_01080 [Methylococcales bacterium]|nr:hypothetical protein [Methylococcales bacterium]